MKGHRAILLLFSAALPHAVLTAWWAAEFLPAAASMAAAGRAAAVSSILAQNGLVLLVILVFLGGRNPLVERRAGLDRMLRLHRPLAVVALGLLLSHVFLQFLRFYAAGGYELVRAALLTTDIWEMVVGRLALFILLAGALAAVLGIRFRIPFRVWKPFHLLVYAAVPMGLVHAAFRGGTMGEFPRLQIMVLLAVSIALAVSMRVLVVRKERGRTAHEVSGVVEENHDTRSLCLKTPPGSEGLPPHRPGQFVFLRIPRGRGLSEPHPFTISGAPSDETRLTIKRAGEFTRDAHNLVPGDRVLVNGPYGVFCAGAEEEPVSLALIAGGVGVTPFLSLLRHFGKTGRAVPAVLLWANKTTGDIFCGQELEDMCREMPLRVVHVLSREKDPPPTPENGSGVVFLKGRITAEIMGRYLRPDQGFYLCGPPAMQTFVLAGIREVFNLRKGRVSRELFFW
jgi:predicted ferric reductase